jgi:hypothetical protein
MSPQGRTLRAAEVAPLNMNATVARGLHVRGKAPRLSRLPSPIRIRFLFL